VLGMCFVAYLIAWVPVWLLPYDMVGLEARAHEHKRCSETEYSWLQFGWQVIYVTNLAAGYLTYDFARSYLDAGGFTVQRRLHLAFQAVRNWYIWYGSLGLLAIAAIALYTDQALDLGLYAGRWNARAAKPALSPTFDRVSFHSARAARLSAPPPVLSMVPHYAPPRAAGTSPSPSGTLQQTFTPSTSSYGCSRTRSSSYPADCGTSPSQRRSGATHVSRLAWRGRSSRPRAPSGRRRSSALCALRSTSPLRSMLLVRVMRLHGARRQAPSRLLSRSHRALSRMLCAPSPIPMPAQLALPSPPPSA
jgi:hypothetical protein